MPPEIAPATPPIAAPTLPPIIERPSAAPATLPPTAPRLVAKMNFIFHHPHAIKRERVSIQLEPPTKVYLNLFDNTSTELDGRIPRL